MRYTVKTTMAYQDVLGQAKDYFGPESKGLTLTSEHPRTLRWQGGDGSVTLMVKSEAPTLLEIETQVWNEAMRQFIAELPKQRSWWARWWHRSV
jgi:hypothetical protein